MLENLGIESKVKLQVLGHINPPHHDRLINFPGAHCLSTTYTNLNWTYYTLAPYTNTLLRAGPAQGRTQNIPNEACSFEGETEPIHGI